MGSTAPTLKKLMKTLAASTILTYQSSKRKATQGVNQKPTTGKRLRRTKSSIAQAFESASTNLSSANPRKEPITTEITDASDRPKIVEDKNLSTSPPDATKTPPKKISTQEQRSNIPTVEDDPVDADTQTVDPSTQQTVDDTSIESPEPIQPNVEKDVGTSSTALISLALSYSFNFEEYINKSEISSSSIISQETLSDETKNRLKDMLPMLERNIANLVQDADPMRRIFLAIKDNLTPNLAEALIPISNIEDQAPKVKKAQRNLIAHEALIAKKNSNKQEAKKLAQLIDNLKISSSKIELGLNQLRVRRAELEKELESVKATIERHESNLTQVPNAIKQKKQEMLTKHINLMITVPFDLARRADLN
ncbi:uncharacterized protein [Miscanthus floridulus]|uniref:uncharacterized protein n=1 Tax=Miscanthus floridulus TaxID=154761 RepID=UPI00345A3981